MKQLLLGIDIGTYSSKGVLCQPNGEIIAEVRTNHDMSIPKPGYAEQDADAVWWADFKKISKELTTKVPSGDKIAGVGVSAIGACVLPVDQSGKPLRPGILYGVDTRAIEQIDALEKEYSRDAMIELGGSRLTSQAIGPKILWIKENEPEVYEKTAKFITATSYIIFKLTGKYVIDAHTATEFNPLLSIHAIEWDGRFAEKIATLDKLPEIGWSDKIAGQISIEAAKATGIPEGTPVNFGAVDALSEAISVGVINPGELMIMYGSTAFMIFLIKKPIATNELWLEAGAFEGQYEYSAGLSTSGSATTWFRDQFGKDCLASEQAGSLNAYAALAKEAAGSPIGSNGLITLPYLSGERTPIFDPKARGVIAGLSLSHCRGDLYRSLLEGTAFAIRMNLDAMQKNGAQIHHGVAVGGGSSNELWLQMVSDITGIPQFIPEKTIGAAYGDAFLAGLATGIINKIDILKRDWVKITRKIDPNPENKRFYDQLFPLFVDLYQNSKSVVHSLTDLQV
ncbi:MAG: FGGY-family carbohydrate kinase [Chloroflexi bacterium]|nr:FGGY-family carbohydrate kinase [Chloroflexota bacterium]